MVIAAAAAVAVFHPNAELQLIEQLCKAPESMETSVTVAVAVAVSVVACKTVDVASLVTV